MSNEIIFLLLVFTPLFIFGLLMTRAQRRLLKLYRKINNPDKPISFEEVMKLFIEKINNKNELLKFIKNDFNKYPSIVSEIYWKHYRNARLEEAANAVRKYTILSIVVPMIGFLITFIIALLR